MAVAGDYKQLGHTLYCYTLAKDEAEALTNAMKIRDRVIEEGEW